MLPDLSNIISILPIELFLLLGNILFLTILSFVYYSLLIFIILLFFNPTFKQAFFSENYRASTVASIFFIIYVFVGLLYGTFLIGSFSNIESSLNGIFFLLLTSLIIAIIVQETGKKIWTENTVFYDSIISFITILVFISPTTFLFELSGKGDIMPWFIAMTLAVPLLLLFIRKYDFLKFIIKMLYGGKDNDE